MSKIRNLTCCCCSEPTQGRQWWNRDSGFGVCKNCIERAFKNESEEELENMFGKRGYHYLIEEEKKS